ncbi:MAG: PAS domain-containing sensor histidine kinase [Azospirillaceae bacterium]|nr:PAS domain-containing sensor histidine kinase [Azospirillaceae bacterium]
MTIETDDTASTLWRQILKWASRVGLANKAAVALTVAAICSGVATYGALTANRPLGDDPATVSLLLNLDLIFLLLLGVVIARRIVALWSERRRGRAGSRLQLRLVAVFSVIAVTPAILVAVFSAVFFYLGVQSWFSDRVRTAINESLQVAEAYLHEHQQVIRADALAMANDLNHAAPYLIGNPARFNDLVETQAALRSLSEAIVIDSHHNVLARSGLTFSLEFETIPEFALAQARTGEVAVLVNDKDDRVRALVKLDGFSDTYLFVGRMVESRVLTYMESAHGAAQAYSELETRRSSLQITFTLIFVVVALLLLLTAVWIGLNFATALVEPIRNLIAAAEHVRAGDLAARVPIHGDGDELDSLARAFNRMTSQLQSQRTELIDTNRQLDQRRRFTEAVLAGVSAGVLGLNADGVIYLANLSAAPLLGVGSPGDLIDRPLIEVVPEMHDLLDQVQRRAGRLAEGQINLKRPELPIQTLFVRVAADSSGNENRGFVVTVDDISELLSAQRKAAWADIARRIAHEIKNPLTPIQLSAERLRRRFLKEITSDPETFRMCTDTISRQVEDIGRMVDEFSAFARMPTPVMKLHNLNDLCRQGIFLQSSAHANIRFVPELPPGPVLLPCDARQMSQALTNLLQNAVDAIEGRTPAEGEILPPGEIHVAVAVGEDSVTVAVADNGRGLPNDDRERLTEPYVTTRAKGTGLGLAIVKKIMEDHGGTLVLADREGGGACICLVVPRSQDLLSDQTATGHQQKQINHGT